MTATWWDDQNHADQKEWPDKRVNGWAPGDYTCTCVDCGVRYLGDKRSVQCFPCAAKFVTPPRPETLEEKCARLSSELKAVHREGSPSSLATEEDENGPCISQ